MTNEQKAYAKEIAKDAITSYKRGKLNYVEAVLTILEIWKRGELDITSTEYALRLLNQTKGVN